MMKDSLDKGENCNADKNNSIGVFLENERSDLSGDELSLDALHLRAPADKNDSHSSLDLVSHTQRTGARGDGLVGRGRIPGFEDSFEDSMSLGESFAIDDRDEPRRANPNTYRQLEAIQDMTEVDDEDDEKEDEDEDGKDGSNPNRSSSIECESSAVS
jgi:hypothetical protein